MYFHSTEAPPAVAAAEERSDCALPAARPMAPGRFITLAGEKFYARGVTYGAFRPDEWNNEYTDLATIERDFAMMSANGINTVRIPHTMPPRTLLDAAERHRLKVMVGLSCEYYIGYLIDRGVGFDINRMIREKVRTVAGHPALLCYALGNEIPAHLVRWLGPRRVERYLRGLYESVKSQDPAGLVTYVNYPTAEYLRLEFLDLLCFNVYLESADRLVAYLARLHNLAGERPLMLSEVGLDSLRHGLEKQAEVLGWQLRTAFAEGCAGAFVFAWTDEWYRAGEDVEDWKFGITDAQRNAKPALAAVRAAYEAVPFGRLADGRPVAGCGQASGSRFDNGLPSAIAAGTCDPAAVGGAGEGQAGAAVPHDGRPLEAGNGQPAAHHSQLLPRVSVVVCTHNGRRTIRDTLEGLAKLTYPDFEVIVVDDGSTDGVSEVVNEYTGRLIRTANAGLSSARNTGLRAATGQIVAYIDDDAWPDPHWLHHLAHTFATTDFAAVGGPNLAPPGDGLIAEAVACSPGGPAHVLLDDREAEHIPGCNMAFRRETLEAVGGFDPRFRVAGDDVDICWRLQANRWKIGYCAAAVVWHHRRSSVRAYWKQQFGYGRAEALLERKWPEKYNGLGHLRWAGRVYARGMSGLFSRSRIYHGQWGGAPFQSREESAGGVLSSLPMMPEWYLVITALGGLSLLGVVWWPLLAAAPLALLAGGLTLAQAAAGARQGLMGRAWRGSGGWEFRAEDTGSGVQGSGFRIWRRSAGQALSAICNALARRGGARLLILTVGLHLLQPLARLSGRVRHGLTPWRWRGQRRFLFPWPRRMSHLRRGAWQGPQEHLEAIETRLRSAGLVVQRGGSYDRWDLAVRGGLLGGVRMLMAIEDHGPVTQLIRLRVWPTFRWAGVIFAALLAAVSLAALLDGALLASAVIAMGAAAVGARMVAEAGHSFSVVLWMIRDELAGGGALAANSSGRNADADASELRGRPDESAPRIFVGEEAAG